MRLVCAEHLIERTVFPDDDDHVLDRCLGTDCGGGVDRLGARGNGRKYGAGYGQRQCAAGNNRAHHLIVIQEYLWTLHEHLHMKPIVQR